LSGTITKLDAARRQLLAAIHVHWYLQEPLAVYTLAANAWEICNALLKRTTRLRMFAEFAGVHGKPEKELIDLFNGPRNFVKHADRDPDDKAPDLDDSDCDAMIEVACMDYLLISNRSPLFFGLYIAWYSALYPEKTGAFFRERADELFPGISKLPRVDQVKAARGAADRWGKDRLMSAPKSELSDNWRWIELRRWASSSQRV
jgi:hypothetical protein